MPDSVLSSVAPVRRAHRFEESVSSGLAVLLALVGGLFFFRMQGWTPESDRWIYLLAWLVLGYLAVQLIMLLSTSIDSRGIGFVDTVMGLVPALVGVVVAVESGQGILKLSGFQEHALYLMIGTSLLEALITLWVRFTVNRRTIGIDTTN